MQRVTKNLLQVATVALAALWIATSAAAQPVDTKGEKELTALGQKVDKTSASADSSRVTGKIVEQWKETQFRFEKGGTPRALTAQDVQDYRAKGLGYGEISILLALAAKQEGTSAKSVNEILAMRQTDKMGWGNIAKALGYKSLGSVKQSVKATQASVERVAASGKAEKVSTEKPAKAEKPERVRVEKPERAEKPGR